MDYEKREDTTLHVDELRLMLDYYSEHPPPWIELNIPPLPKKKKMSNNDVKVVEKVLWLLKLSAEYFRDLWNWSDFAHMFLRHDDSYVVWLACQCMAIVLQLTESEKLNLIYQYIDSRSHIEYLLLYNTKPYLCDKNLHSYVTNDYITVEEVSLPIVGPSKQNDELILVHSTKKNIRNLALAISAGKVVCLVGPVGSGKSVLIRYLADITGHSNRKLLTVQLGDETDSKMMLGSYHCTDIPGEFVWQPGVLTKAVTEGLWLLLEDIDCASSDLAAVLVSLIENNSLTVPGFRDRIIPATGFQLFFTQRILATACGGSHQKHNIATDLLEKHSVQVNVEPLTKNELIEVVETKFPILKTIATKIVDVFLLFSVGFHEKYDYTCIKSISRLTSTRDLMKWCSRAVNEYSVTSSESALKVIQDAIDVFCCSAVNSKIRIELACHIASLIGVIKTKAEYILNEYKPTIVLGEKFCIAGRVTLPRTDILLTENNLTNSKFALTRSSSCLLERVACCIAAKESVLLVGETGTGKTSTLQLLARHTGNKLIVLNMNQQSDSVDLVGGYKPVELKYIVKPIREEFENLFRAEFNIEQNTKFLGHISTCFNNQKWQNLIKLIKHVTQKALNKNNKSNKPVDSWLKLNEKLTCFENQFKQCQTAMAFAYVEGSLIRAVKEGYWVLLDEINLASAETLQCLSSLLESCGTINVYERKDTNPIIRHKNFRLMAAMNPATDIGKKDLPPGIRNRFTEFYVDELTERSDLITMTACYLPDYTAQKLNAMSKFYLIAKRESEKSLVDGTGHKPHYSLRTYCRALAIASSNPCQSAQRSLYESFCLSFLTQLDSASHKTVESLISSTIFGEKLIQGVINQPIMKPSTGSYVQFEGYWISKGNLEPLTTQKYILTDSVKKNLRDLVRAVSLSCYPVLIQGDTCVGKTSLITYLAAASGNILVRINNHEHTDLQEYIGSYSAESLTGQLVFKEGVLVEAMRKGNWIVLDELNLAPTDVLEALNRVLDDNRELFIPETQTLIKAHPGFRLFATQNPPGLYGGRKILSRAFKNRFIEMHFDEIPANELETILYKRCEMPPSYAKKVVFVMKDLQSNRKGSAAFAGKHGFITLRDLFRWGERYRLANAPENYNWNQHLADEGFLVLASKVRKQEEEQIIIQTLEKHFKCSLSLDRLFTLSEKSSLVTRHILEKIQQPPLGFQQIFLSKNIRRMIVLCCKAIEFNEPILLVGETGCGKTTVCQMIACIISKKLLTVNCHQHTESSDFLGGLRPVRSKENENDQRLFEWVDGPLIKAMVEGHMFLADEISLADDSVLERFNSLLEPERKILLSEKLGNNNSSSELVAHPGFCFVGTMNPGGDYGKKELSPALRNRLTEIWCVGCSDNDDLIQIIKRNFLKFHDYNLYLSESMTRFVNWLTITEPVKNYLKMNISIRDFLIWVQFIEAMMNKLSSDDSNYNNIKSFRTFYKEGAIMIFLDKKTTSDKVLDEYIYSALRDSLLDNNHTTSGDVFGNLQDYFPHIAAPKWFGYDGYYIPQGNLPQKFVAEFSFETPIAKQNIKRLLRCMQIENRAILLEGSPGVGKTSLVQAIAKASGHELTRINLSEQTDVSDLFGADLPTDGGDGGSFEWRDGPFLRALKEGSWILLDELNLASQSVLEGLNAVLDHRGELYIPELGKTFLVKSKNTRLFACQNPMNEGGARKGLPKSFLNRFLQVYLDILDSNNIVSIIKKVNDSNAKKIESLNLDKVVNFTETLSKKYNVDFNLRDILRWVEVTIKFDCNILDHLPLILTDRMANLKCVENEVFAEIKNLLNIDFEKYEYIKVLPSTVLFNRFEIPRKCAVGTPIDQFNQHLILRSHIHTLNSLAVCIKMNWMPILVGTSSGKTSVVKTLAQLCGQELRVLPVNSSMDSVEILGGFEQADYNRHLEEIAKKVESCVYNKVSLQLIDSKIDCVLLLALWYKFQRLSDVQNSIGITMASETSLFKQRISALVEITNLIENSDFSSQLKMLINRVNVTGSLNAGGKFEWIDSLLVKCLNNGIWLLIDNVNLCSPAVLDRLNGLLEPNGCLVLGEKGIGSDGHLTIIKPHENFRLFLAMDPKHGPISRAMKNRGVEIYMETLEESSVHDIHSLLELQGIKNYSIRYTLIEIHKSIKNLKTGVNINHLLRTAYLIYQNLKRKQPILQIIRETCIDIYLQSVFGNSKQNAILEIDRILANHNDKLLENHILYSNIKTLDVLQSANLCYIQQQSDILKQYKKINNISLEDLLLSYFGRSSSTDLITRSQWLLTNINFESEAILNFIKCVPNLEFDMLTYVNKTINCKDYKDLPYDCRYLPVIYYNNTLNKMTPSAENKIHLILEHALNKALDDDSAIFKNHKKREMIQDGGMLHDYAVFSAAFDDFIDYFLNEYSLVIDEINYRSFKEIICWTRTIEKLIYLNLEKNAEFLIVLTYCYFSVIVKHFIPLSESITIGEKYAYLERLKLMRDEVQRNYLTPKRYAKLLKCYVKRMQIPIHQCCKFHADILIEAHIKHNEYFSAIKSKNNIELSIIEETKIQRNKIIKISNFNCDTFKTSNVDNNFKEFCGVQMNDLELKLLPLWELIIEKLFLVLVHLYFDSKNTFTTNNNIMFSKSLLQYIPTVSPFYYHSLKSNQVSIDFLLEALKHSLNSVAVDCPTIFLELSDNKNVCLHKQDEIIDKDIFSFEQPLFSVFMTKILLKKNEPYYIFAPKPIRSIHHNNHNMKLIKQFIKYNFKWTTKIQFTKYNVLIKLTESFFSSLLPVDFTSLEELYLTRDDDECRKSVSAKVNHHETMVTAIYDAAKEISYIKRNIYLSSHMKSKADNKFNSLSKQLQYSSGRLWIISGMCLLEVFSAISPVDPIQKLKVKIACSEAEKNKLQSRLNAEKIFCEVEGISELFPFRDYFIQRLKALNDESTSLGYRPEPPVYNYILEEVTRFSKMYGLDSNTYSLINSDQTNREQIVSEMDNWLSSVASFHDRLNEHYAAYPDVLSGILLSVNQMRYGMRILRNYFKWSLERETHITHNQEKLLRLLGEFPRYCPDIMEMVDMDDIASMNTNDKFRWYKLCLEELNNMLYLSRLHSGSTEHINTIRSIIEKFVYNWKCLQEEEEHKKQEQESLYKLKSVCEVTSVDADIAQGVTQQFPTTKMADFNDIEGPNTLDSDIIENNTEELYNLTDKDINDICRLHDQLVRPAALTHWLSPTTYDFDESDAIFRIKNTFSERFCMFGKLLLEKFMYLDYSLDNEMIPWMLLATDIASNPTKPLNKSFYDFYRDSNIEYAIKTFDLLRNIEDQIKSLLEEWPDHPTLQTIMKVIDRMMEFDWCSPTCRFLVGLELLLTKLHEWEEVAHRGISVNELVLKVSYCIQDYRNLELSTWNNCLQYTFKKLQNDSCKWWFHLYSIFHGYLNKQDSFQQLIVTLQKFMESSTLGQFSTRLKLLYTFHCDIINREQSKEQIEMCNASWNLYKYYSQFESYINTQIENLTADVKKKLRDFVKIIKWNDINYWSIKETVTKVQQTLHKYTREYEEILNNPASTAMTIQHNNTGTKVDPYVLPSFNLNDYTKECEITINLTMATEVLANVNKYSKKLTKLAHKTMDKCQYPNYIAELNEFINGVLESAEDLRMLQISSELPKDKQKSQAKQFLQQKRKALSELFKALQQIGLSFKSGLMSCEKINDAIDFARLPPVEINAAFDSLTPKPADNDIRCAWLESETYFIKSVSQTTALKIASEKPKLGQQDMDRIKGFLNDLVKMTWKSKKVLAYHVDLLVQYRSMLYLSDIITQSDSIVFNPSENIKCPINYIINSINVLQQLKVYIQCYDQSINSDEILFNLLSSKSSEDKNSSFIDSPKITNDVISNLNDIINRSQNYLTLMTKEKSVNAMKLSKLHFITKNDYADAVSICELISQYINNFYREILMVEKQFPKIRAEHELFTTDASIPSEHTSTSLDAISQLINLVLKSVEKLYKKYNDTQLNNDDEKLLKCQIIQSLSVDLEICDLNLINKQLKNVLKLSVGDNILRSCQPLFEQYALLVQFFITQQTMSYRVLSKMSYTLSALFTDLATNGFCVPDEFLEGEECESTDGKSGMGLTEGEGKKDVSDQIESQDQLEDAKKNYDDEPESQKDLKEEEKGVEMSDDFDGKLHDLEKEVENSDHDEENDNDDQDKEMGETGEGADTLDEKLWGSDSEDENGEDQEDENLKEDDGKGGDDFGDKQLGAKNDNENGEEQDETGEMNQKNNKNDINEINENGEDAGEDHSDPHHGDLPPPPEPEPMDLPNDLQLDEGEMNENDEGEENPFDIDTMKENMENVENKDEINEEPKKDKNDLEDTSDEEENGNKIEDDKGDENDENDENIQENEEDNINDDGGKKDEKKTGEEPREENEKIEQQENIKPSEDESSKIEVQPSNIDNGGSKDQICKNSDGKEDQDNVEENKEEATGPEQQGVGRSQRESKETQQGHSTDQDKGAQSEESGIKEKKRRMRPGQKDTDRTLSESIGPMKKRLKTTGAQEEDNEEDSGINENEDNNEKGDLFKHVKESKKSDTETLDAALNEQLENRPLPNNEDESSEELKDDDIEMEENIDEEELKLGEDLVSEKIKTNKHSNQPTTNESENLDDENLNDEKIDVDGDIILTHTVERGTNTMFYTGEIKSDEELLDMNVNDHKELLQEQFNKWLENENKEIDKNEAWDKCIEATSSLAQELSEQLRLVLEPSKASRLQGDFRTGRRINMRRVIPYIASQFRKDKIWLRRTKPSKRQYQIIMAVDNSSSMMDSHAKVLAFESLALVSKALTLVEAGELGVMSFGEQAKIIHPLGEPFAEQSGAKLVHNFTFDEQKTKVGEMIEIATTSFKDRGRLDSGDQPAQLLVIISDGRGIKSEGPDVVKNAIRSAKTNGVIIVFLVIDNPTSKESILDVKMPIFENNTVRIESYMDNFPFPFYVILRDVEKLPSVLSDALREWFELVTI
ncbi:midasin [Daktulosphaira vitifoliae]|uniref:midasin n=1 Tax=Daktulosphaira vitifoliae TaxID=58002 RepID=UPI0021A9D427|nr:midasin [Daktulosphaira vitifoliae]